MCIPRAVAAACIAVCSTGLAYGQDYPSKIVRLITLAGGSNEVKARLIAQAITPSLGQQVVVDFRPTPIILNETIAKAPPDGYSMLIGGGSIWVQPFFSKVPYDALRDFSPITLVDRSPTTLSVHPSMPVKTVKDLIALAKLKPGQIDYATGLPGNSSWIAMELFKSMAGVNMRPIPYKSLAQTITALVSGEVQVNFSDLAPVLPHMQSGRLRVLAVTSAQPSALAPGLPTIAAAVPGYEYLSYTVILAPAKVPEPIINRLNREIVRALNSPDLKQKFLELGIDTLSSTPEELTVTMKADMAKIGKLARDLNIHAE